MNQGLNALGKNGVVWCGVVDLLVLMLCVQNMNMNGTKQGQKVRERETGTKNSNCYTSYRYK